MICKLFGLSYCLIGLKGLLVDSRIGTLVDCCLVFSLLYGMMYGMLFVCYLVRRLVCTLLGVLLIMLLYAWLGMMLDSTLLWDRDTLLMRRLICSWSDWLLCHCVLSLFGSSRFSMKSHGGHYFHKQREP